MDCFSQIENEIVALKITKAISMTDENERIAVAANDQA